METSGCTYSSRISSVHPPIIPIFPCTQLDAGKFYSPESFSGLYYLFLPSNYAENAFSCYKGQFLINAALF